MQATPASGPQFPHLQHGEGGWYSASRNRCLLYGDPIDGRGRWSHLYLKDLRTILQQL